jgi:hypothetical protein
VALNKNDIPRPVLPKEAVDVPELGGEVIVRALLLQDRLEFSSGGSAHYGKFAQMLARGVIDANDEPIFSAAEWEIFGAKEEGQAVAFRLFDVLQRLSGLGEAPDPNPQAPS